MKFIRSAAITFALSVLLVSLAQTQTTLPAPRQETLLNGLKVLMWPDPSAQNVEIRVRIHAGAAFDPQGKEGVMKMLAENIFPNESAREYFHDDLGGNLEIVANYDYIEVTASGKADSFLTMLETLSTAISNPAIDKETTAKLRAAQLTMVKQLESDPAYVADTAVASRLLGTYPYGRPMYGSSGSIQKIDFADLIGAKERFLTADNATVAISGNFETGLGLRAIKRYFGSWLKSDGRVPSAFRQPDPPPSAVLIADSPDPNVTAIRFAMRGLARSDKDLGAECVLSNILEDRLKRAAPPELASNITVRSEEHIRPGVVVIGFSGRHDDNAKERTDAADLILKALSGNVTDAEFTAARAKFAADWDHRDPISFWLDADTFQIADRKRDQTAADNVTIGDVNAYLARLRTTPMAAVMISSTPKAS